MWMECGTPESPAAPSLPILLAMVNVATKANSFVFEKLALHITLVATAPMLEKIPKRYFLGNLDPYNSFLMSKRAENGFLPTSR